MEVDFSNLYWNIHGATQPITELFPEIDSYPEFKYSGEKQYDRDKLLRYIIYLYSEGTPLLKKYKDNLLQRKTEALKLAGLKLNDSTKSDLFEFQDKDFVRMVVKMLAIQKNGLFNNIILNEQAFQDNMSIILSPIIMDSDKDVVSTQKQKGELLKLNNEIQDRLNGYYKEFYKNDLLLQKEGMKIEFRETTPEGVAKIERAF